MRLKLWPLFLFLIVFPVHAYELIMIQGVSDTKRTFVTRNGKRQGIIPGITGTFTAEDISVLAKATTVTGNFTQWELVNKEAQLPFEKGAIVTYYPATEYIWALAPEKERRKYIKSQVPTLKKSWLFKGGFSRGLSDSVSETPASANERGGYMAELYREQDFYYNFAWDIGVRFEREMINYTNASYQTDRTVLIADIIYYMDAFQEYINGKLYMAMGLGYGLSETTTVTLRQTGYVGLLPVVKLGVALPLNEDWEFLTDGAFESLQTQETQQDGRLQTTTQTNFKIGFGLRRFL